MAIADTMSPKFVEASEKAREKERRQKAREEKMEAQRIEQVGARIRNGRLPLRRHVKEDSIVEFPDHAPFISAQGKHKGNIYISTKFKRQWFSSDKVDDWLLTLAGLVSRCLSSCFRRLTRYVCYLFFRNLVSRPLAHLEPN